MFVSGCLCLDLTRLVKNILAELATGAASRRAARRTRVQPPPLVRVSVCRVGSSEACHGPKTLA
jgi:hypothetical protein